MPAQTVIKLRKDSAANWASVNPILANGEVGVDVDVYKFKVGNGSSTWTALPFASDPESVVAGLEAYADGAADAAEAAAISSANSYSDGLAANYDPAGTATSAVSAHNSDTTSVHGIADTTVLLTTAGGTLTGYLTLHADPTQALHAATKEYVDNVATGIIAKPQVLGATTANIDATYDNGTAGVGATLTHNTNGVFPSSAGGATGWQLGSGILVKNQTNKAQNGRYYISNMGSASTPYVLTRCGYCDTADEIPGAYIFVQGGTSAGTGWIQVVADPATFVVGTDNIDVFQFSGAGTYTAGNGLTLTGNSFAVDGTAVPLIQLTTPTEGQTLIYNESTGLWNNGEGGSSVEVSQAAPAAPEVGDVWFNSTEGTSYIYYDGYWVPLTPAIAGPEGPTGPAGPSAITTEGDLAVGDSSGEPSRLPIGTTGQILQSNGTTATWTAPAASGSMTLLSTTSLAGLTSVTVSNINQNYKDLRIEIDGDPENRNTNPLVTLNFKNGSTNLNGSFATLSVGDASAPSYSLGIGQSGQRDFVLLYGSYQDSRIISTNGNLSNYSSNTKISVFNFSNTVSFGPSSTYATTTVGAVFEKVAINGLTVTGNASFPTGSTLRIYGVN